MDSERGIFENAKPMEHVLQHGVLFSGVWESGHFDVACLALMAFPFLGCLKWPCPSWVGASYFFALFCKPVQTWAM